MSLAPLELSQTVLQGSFLPAALLIDSKKFDINKMVFDPNQDTKLVHYLGHFGNVKAFRFFRSVQQPPMDLEQEDCYGQTIVHYAARQGRLALLYYLNTKEGLDLDRPNCYGITPVIYTLVQGHFKPFLYLFMGGGVEIQEKMAIWATNEVVKTNKPLQVIQVMTKRDDLKVKVMAKLLQSALEHRNETALQLGLSLTEEEDQICTLMTQDPVMSSMIAKRLAVLRYKKNGCYGIMCLKTDRSVSSLFQNWFKPFFYFQILAFMHIGLIILVANKGDEQGNHLGLNNGSVMINTDFTYMLILMFGQSFFWLFVCLLSQPGYKDQLMLKTNGNSLQVMFNEMSNWLPLREQTQIEDTCLHCLLVNRPGQHHCKDCEKCVSQFWFHSNMFNKCVGQSNIRSYFLHRMFELALSMSYVALILMRHNTLQTSYFLTQLIESHFRRPILSMIVLFISEAIFIYNLQVYIEMSAAVTWGLTLNQYRNIEECKHRFKRLEIKERPKKSMYSSDEEFYRDHYALPSVTFCQQITNWLRFVTCGCWAEPNYTEKKIIKKISRKQQRDIEMRAI